MGDGGSISIELVQVEHRRFDPGYNAAKVIEAVRGSDSDLIVFPEMFLSGYVIGRDVNRLAVSRTDGIVRDISKAVEEKGLTLVLGAPEKSDIVRGQVHNSAFVFRPNGEVVSYRKMHLVDFDPFEEWAYFTPGRDPLIFEVKGVRIGLMICYDIFFPELSKYYSLSGADALVCISASPSQTRQFFETVLPARAVEDTVFMVYSNLVGMDGRMDFWGGATVISPRGKVLAKGPYHQEAKISAELDMDALGDARTHRPTLRDTRPDIYERILGLIKGAQP